MSLFEGLDIASASDSPFGVSVGTHKFILSASKERNNDDNKWGLILKYVVIGDDSDAGNHLQEWKTIKGDNDTPKETENNNKWMKARLKDLGIPEHKMNTLETEDLNGIEGWMTVGPPTAKSNFPQLRSVTIVDPNKTPNGNPTQATGGENPFSAPPFAATPVPFV